jgi:hypothetical protein
VPVRQSSLHPRRRAAGSQCKDRPYLAQQPLRPARSSARSQLQGQATDAHHWRPATAISARTTVAPSAASST